MQKLLMHHMSGCTPLTPCHACMTAAFLKSKLSDKDMKTLINMLDSVEAKLLDETITLEAPIEHLSINKRVCRILRDNHLATVGDLLKRRESEICSFPRIGRNAISMLREAVERKGRKLGELAEK